jgi:Fur family ferric uptake transcriptional regulator
VGSATVYRSLKILCEAGLLRETFSDSKGRAIYEIFEERGPHHDHMICRDCEAVFEFHSEEIEALQEVLLKKQGFSEDGHRHVVYVRCERLKRPSAGKPATK